jgi:hypothetical protein
VGEPTISEGVVAYTSIAIDNNDIPYIIFSDSVNGDKATVMKYVDSNWVTLGSAGFSAGEARFCAIAIDPNNTPYVAYQDFGHGGYVTVMKYVAGTGINNIAENNFTIYPNPSTGIFNVSFADKIFSVQVFDMAGKLVFSQNVQSNYASVDASSLASGIYNVRAIMEGGVVNKKLVVEK